MQIKNCTWCADDGIARTVPEPATHFYRDKLGQVFGLCDDDSNMLQGDEDVSDELKQEVSQEA